MRLLPDLFRRRAHQPVPPPFHPEPPRIALPPPDDYVSAADEKAAFDRQLRIYADLGFPPPGRHRSEPKRLADTPEVAAARFVRYMLATHDTPTPHMTYADICEAYRRFCVLDHRKPASINRVISAMLSLRSGGVTRHERRGSTSDGHASFTRVYVFGEHRKRKVRRKAKGRRPERPVPRSATIIQMKMAA